MSDVDQGGERTSGGGSEGERELGNDPQRSDFAIARTVDAAVTSKTKLTPDQQAEVLERLADPRSLDAVLQQALEDLQKWNAHPELSRPLFLRLSTLKGTEAENKRSQCIDGLRFALGVLFSLIGAGFFMCVAWKAMGKGKTDFGVEHGFVVFGAAAFAVGAVRLMDRLSMPLTLLLQMETVRAQSKKKDDKPETELLQATTAALQAVAKTAGSVSATIGAAAAAVKPPGK